MTPPSLDELAEKLDRVAALPPDVALSLLPLVIGLQTSLLARVLKPGATSAPRDRLLPVAEAASRLGQSKEWLYKHAATLPFVVRNGRALRFSEAGIEAWIRRQQRA